MQKLNLSISIISYNEEKNIGRTLESIADIASEIIIFDSHSTDKTKEIAESFGAKVILAEWEGHIKQKNKALKSCTQEWIIALDCDEVITPELKSNIINAINNGTADGYKINRETFYIGKLLKYAWQPDWNLRLVRTSSNPRWEGKNPHDELKIDGNIEKLEGSLTHYSYKDMNNHFEKTIYYARLSAKTYFNMGKKFSLINLFLNPWVAFVRLYFIRQGFRDGMHGLIAGFSTFTYTALKYFFLWELEQKK
jgi:glycosyltransferase involved in cell wall biosynthesis